MESTIQTKSGLPERAELPLNNEIDNSHEPITFSALESSNCAFHLYAFGFLLYVHRALFYFRLVFPHTKSVAPRWHPSHCEPARMHTYRSSSVSNVLFTLQWSKNREAILYDDRTHSSCILIRTQSCPSFVSWPSHQHNIVDIIFSGIKGPEYESEQDHAGFVTCLLL